MVVVLLTAAGARAGAVAAVDRPTAPDRVTITETGKGDGTDTPPRAVRQGSAVTGQSALTATTRAPNVTAQATSDNLTVQVLLPAVVDEFAPAKCTNLSQFRNASEFDYRSCIDIDNGDPGTAGDSFLTLAQTDVYDPDSENPRPWWLKTNAVNLSVREDETFYLLSVAVRIQAETASTNAPIEAEDRPRYLDFSLSGSRHTVVAEALSPDRVYDGTLPLQYTSGATGSEIAVNRTAYLVVANDPEDTYDFEAPLGRLQVGIGFKNESRFLKRLPDDVEQNGKGSYTELTIQSESRIGVEDDRINVDAVKRLLNETTEALIENLVAVSAELVLPLAPVVYPSVALIIGGASVAAAGDDGTTTPQGLLGEAIAGEGVVPAYLDPSKYQTEQDRNITQYALTYYTNADPFYRSDFEYDGDPLAGGWYDLSSDDRLVTENSDLVVRGTRSGPNGGLDAQFARPIDAEANRYVFDGVKKRESFYGLRVYLLESRPTEQAEEGFIDYDSAGYVIQIKNKNDRGNVTIARNYPNGTKKQVAVLTTDYTPGSRVNITVVEYDDSIVFYYQGQPRGVIRNAATTEFDYMVYTVGTEGDAIDRIALDRRNVTGPLPAVPDVTGNGRPATDPDGDDTYEDVTGDGRFTILDVAAFIERYDTPTVRTNASLFDFDGDGEISIVDVARLLTAL